MGIGLILRSFGLAIGQLSDRRFRRVFFLGIALALALLIGFTAAFAGFLDWMVPEKLWLPILGEVTWINDLVSWGALFLMLFLSIILMVPVASAITSMFLDEVADAVEAKHFPDLPQATKVPFGEALRDTINFLGVLVGANVLALVLYALFAPAALFIFWGVNGFLLGREYFTMVAIRWVGRIEAKKLRRRYTGTIWIAGILMAMPLSVPFLNLVIPILGAATFTHLYHGLTRPRHETGSLHHPRRSDLTG
ncbi:EI24 domain-containing protein [Sulfitobacter sp. F26204]|uniref:EI24 domain-containing protein n=1 Tax=Sulfitobacter sp. F26204 TaxID=2996014 RepID=UPI00225E1F2E|nr:EI24 domain-containing protein [Sulfitobacter sp. F26204]MCX7560306.1 EI24 domain-containing protein [Sulfitobacter sp. F26204]